MPHVQTSLASILPLETDAGEDEPPASAVVMCAVAVGLESANRSSKTSRVRHAVGLDSDPIVGAARVKMGVRAFPNSNK
jgi:hypothetical protein